MSTKKDTERALDHHRPRDARSNRFACHYHSVSVGQCPAIRLYLPTEHRETKHYIETSFKGRLKPISLEDTPTRLIAPRIVYVRLIGAGGCWFDLGLSFFVADERWRCGKPKFKWPGGPERGPWRRAQRTLDGRSRPYGLSTIDKSHQCRI